MKKNRNSFSFIFSVLKRPLDKYRANRWKSVTAENKSQLQFFHHGTAKRRPEPGDRWDIPEFLQKTDTAWAKSLISVYRHPMSFPGSVSPQMGALLRALVMNIAPKNVVEIGSYLGVSSLWIASAMAEYGGPNQFHCIDLFLDHTDNPWCPGVTLGDPLTFMMENIKNCGFQEFVTVHQGDSRQLIPKIAAQMGQPIDFALIDGDHSVAGCMADFRIIEEHVATGGYLLFHDVFPDYCGVDGPAFTVDHQLIPSERFEVCQIYTSPLNFGFALVRKVK